MKFVIKGICALVLALALTSLMYAHFKRDSLSEKVLNTLREELSTELKVGYFDVDLLSAFPGIRVDFHDVELRGKGGSQLLKSEDLQLTLSLFSIFSDEIRCSRLLLKNGNVRIERLTDGTLSLQVLQIAGKKDAGGPVLHFNKITLENIGLHYEDPNADQEYQIHFKHGAITGTYGYQQLEFDIGGDVIYNRARIGNSTYLNNAVGSIKGDIILDLDDRLYTFQDMRLHVGKQRYAIHGSVRSTDDEQYVDFEIEQSEGELHSFISLLPASYRRDLPFNDAHGVFTANGFIRGRMSTAENPHAYFDVKVDDGSIESPHGKGSLNALDIEGALDNGAFRNMHSARLELPIIRGNAYGQKFEASLIYADFYDPVIQCTFDGSLPAEFVLDYSGMAESFSEVSGSMHFTGVDIGSLRLGNADFTDIQYLKGQCTLDHLKLQTAQAQYQIPAGTLHLDKDTLRVADMGIKLGQDDLLVNGWMAELGDALEGGDLAYLRYELILKAGSLDISKWIPSLASNASEDTQAHVRSVSLKSTPPIRLPQGILSFSARQFQYDQIHASTMDASVSTKTHHADFNITGVVADGIVRASGGLETQNGYQLDLTMTGDGMNIRECFSQCQNFGQQSVRAEHINGKSDVRVLADVAWNAEGDIDKDKLHVLAGMSIHNGELVGFDMLREFSDYVHVEDLRHIKFARIDNFVEVRKGNVYIPTMFIQSNAANFAVNGVHTLDNRILYNIKLNAGQVLSTKMKRHNSSLTPQPARKEGTFNLFFTLTGTMEAFTYGMNKRSVESSFAQSAELRDGIRDQLRAVFGESIDFIEPPEWETIPEYDLEQKGEEIFLDIHE